MKIYCHDNNDNECPNKVQSAKLSRLQAARIAILYRGSSNGEETGKGMKCGCNNTYYCDGYVLEFLLKKNPCPGGEGESGADSKRGSLVFVQINYYCPDKKTVEPTVI